ncbi:cryptochrome/photolyase family protein [Microbacterium sp. BK668]|uniref:cryptochrome/photolyase family protein n=1 Tax=Microbacterium sp. BK668 TaxID=2512118 RepID=UPI00105E8899|nr:cryptochrome/photolyase family protein [Microbacterium sp. BK668]TDN92631.1 deoxyribodipyrimidine photolyase-related protein [Microbacterium sp. BK668]
MTGTTAALILATQQFEHHPAYEDPDIAAFLFVESAERFDVLPYHRHKIVLLVSAMRHTAARLEAQGRTVHRVPLSDDLGFAAGLGKLLRDHDVDRLAWMSATDRGVDEGIARVCARRGVATRRYEDALFLTPASELDAWFAEHPRTPMEDFYRWQRRRTGILMHGSAPAGKRWNFDADNRKPLPKGGIDVPELRHPSPDDLTAQVMSEVAARFPDHPGDPDRFWLPVTPDEARAHLRDFVDERLERFGPYEDAMAADEPFLFHAVITPMLNIGLLTVAEVLTAVTESSEAPLASVEGFVRQIIGWREYMRGMYRAHPELERANALGLRRRLEDWWYTGRGIPDDLPVPVRTVLERVHRWGYAHHIERLMVLGNWLLLQGYAPRQVNRWFLALFVDAYPWVMVPNVMGMSQYADGGLVGTKPYVSGGAYLQKMGSWWPSAAQARDSQFTEAYWRFLDENEPALSGNPRMSLPLAQMRQRRDKGD